jgi:4-oxalocrotonate tautomerase
VRYRLTCDVHARKVRRSLPSPDIVFTPSQKQEMVRKLTDAMVALEGENMRQVTFVVIDEVKSGDWGIDGKPLTTNAVKALAAGKSKG